MEINLSLFLQTLIMAAKGIAGIFIVTSIIILFVYLLNKITSKKQ